MLLHAMAQILFLIRPLPLYTLRFFSACQSDHLITCQNTSTAEGSKEKAH